MVARHWLTNNNCATNKHFLHWCTMKKKKTKLKRLLKTYDRDTSPLFKINTRSVLFSIMENPTISTTKRTCNFAKWQRKKKLVAFFFKT